MYIDNCQGLYCSVMCHDKSGKYYLFNRKSTESRVREVIAEIFNAAQGWYPRFNNAGKLLAAAGGKWECVDPTKIITRSAKETYADMPKALEDYLRSLPEFDEKVFNKITGRDK